MHLTLLLSALSVLSQTRAKTVLFTFSYASRSCDTVCNYRGAVCDQDIMNSLYGHTVQHFVEKFGFPCSSVTSTRTDANHPVINGWTLACVGLTDPGASLNFSCSATTVTPFRKFCTCTREEDNTDCPSGLSEIEGSCYTVQAAPEPKTSAKAASVCYSLGLDIPAWYSAEKYDRTIPKLRSELGALGTFFVGAHGFKDDLWKWLMVYKPFDYFRWDNGADTVPYDHGLKKNHRLFVTENGKWDSVLDKDTPIPSNNHTVVCQGPPTLYWTTNSCGTFVQEAREGSLMVESPELIISRGHAETLKKCLERCLMKELCLSFSWEPPDVCILHRSSSAIQDLVGTALFNTSIPGSRHFNRKLKYLGF